MGGAPAGCGVGVGPPGVAVGPFAATAPGAGVAVTTIFAAWRSPSPWSSSRP